MFSWNHRDDARIPQGMVVTVYSDVVTVSDQSGGGSPRFVRATLPLGDLQEAHTRLLRATEIAVELAEQVQPPG